MNKHGLIPDVPRRQPRSAIILFVLNFVKRLLKGAWPIILVFLFRAGNEQSKQELLTNAAVLMAGGVSLLFSILAYFRYFFHIEDGHTLVIRQGVLNRSLTRLPFERIQNVRIAQGPVHQLLGVVSLEIETAGSKGQEVSIQALEREVAVAMRDGILEPGRRAEGVEVALEPKGHRILQLSTKDLFLVGLTQNHLATAVLIVGTVSGFFFTLSSAMGWKDIAPLLEGTPFYEPGLLLLLALGVGLLALSVVLTVAQVVLRHFGLALWENERGLSLTEGLLNRKEVHLQRSKVQKLAWRDNPLRRMLGLFRLTFSQATPGEAGLSRNVGVPGCRATDVREVCAAVFPDAEHEPALSGRAHAAMGWANGRYGLLIGGAAAAGLWLGVGQPMLSAVSAGVGVLGLAYAYAYQRKFKWQLSDGYLYVRHGVFAHTYELLPLYKVQAAVLRESWFQRRRGLASLIVHTAGGAVVLPFLPLAIGMQVQDVLLYQAERSKTAWM